MKFCKIIYFSAFCIFFVACDIIRPLSRESAAYRKKMVEKHAEEIASCFSKDDEFEFFVTGHFTNKNFGFMTGSGTAFMKKPEKDLEFYADERILTSKEKKCIGKAFSQIEFPIIDNRVTYEVVSFKIQISKARMFVRYASNFKE
jgi:hypothetical protein